MYSVQMANTAPYSLKAASLKTAPTVGPEGRRYRGGLGISYCPSPTGGSTGGHVLLITSSKPGPSFYHVGLGVMEMDI